MCSLHGVRVPPCTAKLPVMGHQRQHLMRHRLIQGTVVLASRSSAALLRLARSGVRPVAAEVLGHRPHGPSADHVQHNDMRASAESFETRRSRKYVGDVQRAASIDLTSGQTNRKLS